MANIWRKNVTRPLEYIRHEGNHCETKTGKTKIQISTWEWLWLTW